VRQFGFLPTVVLLSIGFSAVVFVMYRVGLNDCPYCGNVAVYRSKPTRLIDRVCMIFLLQIVRCHGCMRQHYRPIFWPTTEFPISAKKSVQTRANDDKRQRSA